jgi:hypothetical protein
MQFPRWFRVERKNTVMIGGIVYQVANRRTIKWTADADIKLKDTVHTHSSKNPGVIASLVPGRTKTQCSNRWHGALDPSIDPASGRTGKWVDAEVIKLKAAVKRTVAIIGAQLPLRFRAERKNSVGADGMMFLSPISTGQVGARVKGQKTKTSF